MNMIIKFYGMKILWELTWTVCKKWYECKQPNYTHTHTHTITHTFQLPSIFFPSLSGTSSGCGHNFIGTCTYGGDSVICTNWSWNDRKSGRWSHRRLTLSSWFWANLHDQSLPSLTIFCHRPFSSNQMQSLVRYTTLFFSDLSTFILLVLFRSFRSQILLLFTTRIISPSWFLMEDLVWLRFDQFNDIIHN